MVLFGVKTFPIEAFHQHRHRRPHSTHRLFQLSSRVCKVEKKQTVLQNEPVSDAVVAWCSPGSHQTNSLFSPMLKAFILITFMQWGVYLDTNMISNINNRIGHLSISPSTHKTRLWSSAPYQLGKGTAERYVCQGCWPKPFLVLA